MTYSAHQAIRHLRTVAPQVERLITPKADHHLAIVKPEWVGDNVLKFLRS